MASGLLWILAIFASVTVHELAHCVVARRRGLRVIDIVLLPIGGVSEILGIERTWRDELIVAGVGPMSSLLLAGLLAALGLLAGQHLWPPTLFSGSWIARIAWANVLLGAFNLIPAFPLDGGRVLHATLVRRWGSVEGTLRAAQVARVLAVVFFVCGIFWDIWLALIGLFVLLAAGEEYRRAVMRGSLVGWKVRDLMVPETPLSADTPVSQDLVESHVHAGRAIPVIGQRGYVGIVEAKILARAHLGRTLGQLADREAPLLDENMDVVPAALNAFDESGRTALAVGRRGLPVGVLYIQRAADAVANGAHPRRTYANPS